MAQVTWCISLDTIWSSHMQNHIMSMTTSSNRHRTWRMLSQRQILIEIIFAIKLYLQLSVLHYANGTSCIIHFYMYLLIIYPCIKFLSNRTIGYGDIAFQTFGGYRKCRHECSCSSARRVPNVNSNTPHGGVYPHIIKLYCNVLGIDNVMPL